jgi:hypothetical protein
VTDEHLVIVSFISFGELVLSFGELVPNCLKKAKVLLVFLNDLLILKTLPLTLLKDPK